MHGTTVKQKSHAAVCSVDLCSGPQIMTSFVCSL